MEYNKKKTKKKLKDFFNPTNSKSLLKLKVLYDPSLGSWKWKHHGISRLKGNNNIVCDNILYIPLQKQKIVLCVSPFSEIAKSINFYLIAVTKKVLIPLLRIRSNTTGKFTWSSRISSHILLYTKVARVRTTPRSVQSTAKEIKLLNLLLNTKK